MKAPAQPARPAVLVVDDDPRALMAMAGRRECEAFEVVISWSGGEALARLREPREFAVMLLDVRMPGMGGFEVARRVKGDERHARLPICFLTASDVDGSDVKDADEAGAADSLAKPVQPWLLRARVSVFVTHWQQAQALQDRLRLELENAEWKLGEARLTAQNERLERSLSDSAAVFASMAEAYCGPALRRDHVQPERGGGAHRGR